MPRLTPQQTTAACIEIIDFQSTYVPGDTLLGHVVAKQAFADGPKADQAWIRLRLFGRAKTKISKNSGQSVVTHQGKAVFFEEQQCIFRGAVTADARIPFTITIPETSQAHLEERGDSWDRELADGHNQLLQPKVYLPGQMFLSSTQENVTEHTLPSVYSFNDEAKWSATKFEAYCEYAIEAMLMCPGTSSVTALLPLLVRAKPTQSPISGKDYEPHVMDSPKTTRSERLLPENALRKLTFREQSRRLFNPSKVPRYSYVVKMIYPSVIQLEHPDPLPLKLYLVPLLKDNQTTICPDGDLRRLPPVEFKSIELKLISLTRLRCQGGQAVVGSDREFEYPLHFNDPSGSFNFTIPTVVRGSLDGIVTPPESFRDLINEKMAALPYLEPGALRPVDESTVVPEGPIEYAKFRPNDDGEYFLGAPFNLGSHLDIRVSEFKYSTLGQQGSFQKPLHASFKTYNIVQSYQLFWSIKLACAGETHTVVDKVDVRILPPSEEEAARMKRALGHEGMRKHYEDLLEAYGVIQAESGHAINIEHPVSE